MALIDVWAFCGKADATTLLADLLAEIPWNDGGFVAAGRRFELPRLQAWFADPGIDYCYAQNLQNSHPWSARLQALRLQVEALTGTTFNAVLANLYRDGRDSVGWHADDEDDLGPTPHIASLSLGARRHFHWRPKPGASGDDGALALPSGTLLLMRAPFQQSWEHAILPEPEIRAPRLNLTFRFIHPLAGNDPRT